MKDYYVIITTKEAVKVNAATEEQAIEIVRSQLPRNIVVDLQVAQEAIIEENKES